MIKFFYNGKKILFTGDLGNSPSPILPDTEKVTDVDYLIMESVYGDRNHESRNERRKFLEMAIEDNYKRKGTLMIPTFSLERSQELLFELNELVEKITENPNAIAKLKVFIIFSFYLFILIYNVNVD